MHTVAHVYLTVNRTKERAYKRFTGSHFSSAEHIPSHFYPELEVAAYFSDAFQNRTE